MLPQHFDICDVVCQDMSEGPFVLLCYCPIVHYVEQFHFSNSSLFMWRLLQSNIFTETCYIAPLCLNEQNVKDKCYTICTIKH